MSQRKMNTTDYVFVVGMGFIALGLLIALITAALHSMFAFGATCLGVGLFLLLGCDWDV